MTSSTWRKSTYSTNQNDCVEIGNRLDAVRDSKNSDGPALHVGRAALTQLVQAIKTGQLG